MLLCITSSIIAPVLQQEEGLVEGLLAMLTMAAAPVPAHAQTLPSAAPALADAPASTGKKSKKEKKAEAVSQAPSAAAVDAAAAAEMVEALPKLASQLAMQVGICGLCLRVSFNTAMHSVCTVAFAPCILFGCAVNCAKRQIAFGRKRHFVLAGNLVTCMPCTCHVMLHHLLVQWQWW